jgi:hypothetical protein
VLHGLHVLSGHISTLSLTASGSRPLNIGKILEGERSAMASRATALSIYFFSSCPIRSARVSLAPSASLSDNECACLIGRWLDCRRGQKPFRTILYVNDVQTPRESEFVFKSGELQSCWVLAGSCSSHHISKTLFGNTAWIEVKKPTKKVVDSSNHT